MREGMRERVRIRERAISMRGRAKTRERAKH